MNGLDDLIDDLVRERHGVVSADELRTLGASREAVRHRISNGRLRPVFRRAYIVSGYPITARARMLAATHACGSGAVVSHTSAATLWGMIRDDPGEDTIHVSVRRQVRPIPQINVHQVSMEEAEQTTHFGVPVTTPTRTLLDAGLVMTKQRLSRAIRQAEVDGFAKHAALEELARSRRPGVKALRRALAPAATPTRSQFEDDVVDLLRALPGTPEFRTNARVAGYEVDIYVPSQNLVIEIDGARWHDTPQARYEDRLKHAALERAGFRVKRVRGS